MMKIERSFGVKGLGWIGLLLLLAIGTALNTAPTFAQSSLMIEAVVLHNANLRAGPGLTYPVIGAATDSQLVTVTDEAGVWYQLVTGEWIAKTLVAATPTSSVVAFHLAEAPAWANRRANLRHGPGTTYAIVGQVLAGQRLQIVGQNQAGDWFKLQDGPWIAAFLVKRVEVGLPIIEVPVAPALVEEAPTVTSDERLSGK